MRRRGNISKRCMVCIMSAMMMMSSVTGTMITPIGAYAQNYANISEMTADENGKYNLAEGDSLDTNTGTIHENNGTIAENAAGATVEINNNIIEKNEGTVVTNAVGATVGTENDEVSGTVVNNYGTAEMSSVEKNYGTAVDSSVIENFKSGTVTGDSVVGTNHGGSVEEGINIEVNEIIVPQNKPAETIEAAPASDTENSNDDPTPPSVITDPTSNLDAAVNGLSDASWDGTNIVLTGNKVLTLEKLAELECESSGYADLFGKGYKTLYEQGFLKAINNGKTVAEARDEALSRVNSFIQYRILHYFREDLVMGYFCNSFYGSWTHEIDSLDDYMNFVSAYEKAFWNAKNEDVTINDKAAHKLAMWDAIHTFNRSEIVNGVCAILLNNGEAGSKVFRYVNKELENDSTLQNYTKKQVELFVETYKKAIEENQSLTNATRRAKKAVAEAGDLEEDDLSVQSGQPQPLTEDSTLQPDLAKYINRDVHENEPHNNSIAPTNATIAPVNAKMASVEQEQNTEAIVQSVKDKLDNSQLSSDGASIVIANGDSYSTLMFAYMDTANVKSDYLNKDAKADVYLTLVDKELTKGASLDQAINDAKKSLKKMNNDLTEDIPNNLTDEQKKAYVETYVMTYKQYMANNVSYDNARKQALLQAAYAANKVHEQTQTADVTNANAAIAPVNNTADISPVNTGIARGREIYDPVSDSWFWLDADANGAMARDKEVFIPYIYQNEAEWDEATMREIANQSDPGMRELVYQDMKEKKGKWVRYGADGKMLKGWVTIEGDLADIYPDQAGNTYYYDSVTGIMAKGVVTLNGVKYSFNEITGALEK